MSDTPERSTGPFTHKASTQRFGKTVTIENTICDAHGNTLISEWYSSWWDSENTQEVDLAPGDWHLFAAAPEMLEALKECRLFIGRMPHPDFVNGGTADLIYKNILHVIAKAEGRQQ
jgi:hypothetical protein